MTNEPPFDIPEVFIKLKNLYVETGEILKMRDCIISMPCEFYVTDISFQISDIFMIILSNDDMNISFNLETPPDVAANIIKFLIKNGYDLEVYESFFFDDHGNFCTESEINPYYTMCLN